MLSYSHYTANELRQNQRLAEQYATHLYWLRFYRQRLNDFKAEDSFILSPSECYQEERIWLTEHSNQELLDSDEVLQESYADHYQRYLFYHHSERICGDEDDFFRLNEMMKRRRNEEDGIVSMLKLHRATTNQLLFEEEQASSSYLKRHFQSDESQYSSPQPNPCLSESNDEYCRFQEMIKRRRQEDNKTQSSIARPTRKQLLLSHDQQTTSNNVVRDTNMRNHLGEEPLHASSDNAQTFTAKQKRNLQQQLFSVTFLSQPKRRKFLFLGFRKEESFFFWASTDIFFQRTMLTFLLWSL